jgi:signal transduction histidine kinase
MPFRRLPTIPISRLIVLWFAFELALMLFVAFVSPLSMPSNARVGSYFLILIAIVHGLFCLFLLRELWVIIGGKGSYVKASPEEHLEIDRSKTEFMTMAAHQLRTPLASLRWNLELVTQDKKRLSKDQREALKLVLESAENMQHIIDALLTTARIELQTYFPERKRVFMARVIRSVLEGDLKTLTKRSKIEISIAIDKAASSFEGDENLFTLLMQNLLDNAVKYTPKGGKIQVSTSMGAEGLQLCVSNNAEGISLQQQMMLFQKPFSSVSRMQYGEEAHQGLGLYIVKSIIERLGWRIWFELGKDQAVTFFILIPPEGNAH